MKKIFILLIFLIPIHKASASIKEIIIQKLVNIDNLNFEFEQNINNKIETGKCTIQYPKKIYCKYDSDNKKILVSNGRSLVIKTLSSYYLYPLNKTPLDIILDKTRRILSKVKPWQAAVIFINTLFGISCWSDFIKRFSSSQISAYVGKGKSTTVIISFKVSGILISAEIIIIFFI